ncbi:MAG: hypothetical protein EOM88_01595 [Clostridia bacterium]|nr:hypothetical protein [Clostridia bacterium]
MKKHYYLIIALSLALLVSLSLLFANMVLTKRNDCLPVDFAIRSFTDCVAAGNEIMETYPEQCRTADGRIFIRDISTNEPIINPGDRMELDSLKLNSIQASDWPYTSFQNLNLELKKVAYDYQHICQELDDPAVIGHMKRSAVLNDRLYCIESQSEGAAGSVYTDYNYTTLINNYLITIKTTVQEVNCQNFDNPQKKACEAERKSLNLDELIDSLLIVDSF